VSHPLYDDDSTNNRGSRIVLNVLPESEAQKTGMRAGDVILEIDGKPTAGNLLKDIVLDSLRGKVGSSSNVNIRRVQENKTTRLSEKLQLNSIDCYLTTKNTKITKKDKIISHFFFVSFVPFVVINVLLELSA
jgi:C-terminal processing protease CtpA/Prc